MLSLFDRALFEHGYALGFWKQPLLLLPALEDGLDVCGQRNLTWQSLGLGRLQVDNRIDDHAGHAPPVDRWAAKCSSNQDALDDELPQVAGVADHR